VTRGVALVKLDAVDIRWSRIDAGVVNSAVCGIDETPLGAAPIIRVGAIATYGKCGVVLVPSVAGGSAIVEGDATGCCPVVDAEWKSRPGQVATRNPVVGRNRRIRENVTPRVAAGTIGSALR